MLWSSVKLDTGDTESTVSVRKMDILTENVWKALVARRLTTPEKSRQILIAHILFGVWKHDENWRNDVQLTASELMVIIMLKMSAKVWKTNYGIQHIDQCALLFFVENDQRLLLVADGCSGKALGFKRVVQHMFLGSPALRHFLHPYYIILLIICPLASSVIFTSTQSILWLEAALFFLFQVWSLMNE